ncbi:MAG: hypothetical protein GEEBNDBF_00040 [bacterium]|nr:hypothetical protein [bacterium]
MTSNRHVLFVDSDQPLLQGLRRLLRPLAADWEMHFAEEPQAARLILSRYPVSVLITELRMSTGESGLSLLESVRETYPGCLRMVLSSFVDPPTMGQLLTLAHQVLLKPAAPEDIIHCIERAGRLHEFLSSDRIARALEQFGALPPCPAIFMELQSVLAQPSSGAGDIARVISQDAVLTARLLRLVNSAAFGLSQSVGSIDRAVTLLGVSQIKSLVLASQTFTSLVPTQWPAEFSYTDFQHQALVRGQLARTIINNPRDAEQAYLAGLLLHTGELALAARMPDAYSQICQIAEGDLAQQLALETAFTGANHAELGGYLLNLWNLPTPLVEAVAYHHDSLAMLGQTTAHTPLSAAVTADALLQQASRADSSPHSLDAHLSHLLPVSLRQPSQLESYLKTATQLLAAERTTTS